MFGHREKIQTLSLKERVEIIERIRTTFYHRPEIIFAYAYGSFVEGMPFRDLDLGIFVRNISPRQAIEYMLALSQMVSSAIGLSADIRIINFSPVTYLFHVIQGELIIDRDEELRCNFLERVIRNYLDLKPRIRRAIREAFIP